MQLAVCSRLTGIRHLPIADSPGMDFLYKGILLQSMAMKDKEILQANLLDILFEPLTRFTQPVSFIGVE